jgi:hypothetical protein
MLLRILLLLGCLALGVLAAEDFYKVGLQEVVYNSSLDTRSTTRICVERLLTWNSYSA